MCGTYDTRAYRAMIQSLSSFLLEAHGANDRKSLGAMHNE